LPGARDRPPAKKSGVDESQRGSGDWLADCAERVRRAQRRTYPVDGPANPRGLAAPPRRPRWERGRLSLLGLGRGGLGAGAARSWSRAPSLVGAVGSSSAGDEPRPKNARPLAPETSQPKLQTRRPPNRSPPYGVALPSSKKSRHGSSTGFFVPMKPVDAYPRYPQHKTSPSSVSAQALDPPSPI